MSIETRGRLHRNIDRDLFQPQATVGFLRRVDLQFVRVRAVNQYGTIIVLNTYVCVWLDRVESLKSFLDNGIALRATACKRQQQYDSNLPKVTPLNER